jgi:hypothetical protein
MAITAISGFSNKIAYNHKYKKARLFYNPFYRTTISGVKTASSHNNLVELLACYSLPSQLLGFQIVIIAIEIIGRLFLHIDLQRKEKEEDG